MTFAIRPSNFEDDGPDAENALRAKIAKEKARTAAAKRRNGDARGNDDSDDDADTFISVAGSGAAVTLGDGASATLGVMDSCFIPAGEAREVRNKTNAVASMIVIMPYPKAPS